MESLCGSGLVEWKSSVAKLVIRRNVFAHCGANAQRVMRNA
jgi:hypothetical protein